MVGRGRQAVRAHQRLEPVQLFHQDRLVRAPASTTVREMMSAQCRDAADTDRSQIRRPTPTSATRSTASCATNTTITGSWTKAVCTWASPASATCSTRRA
ncbi:MAG: hypothetical protein M0C28_28835 [Candidatus Moduliflexus flocculans]|nr:hypothetical protein [Candidatus Moduliflexus flocculans]